MVVNTSPPPAALPITRVEWTSDQKPPWSGLKFTLPVGSDALSDALRSRYRDGENLRERKHMAAIEFLTAELQLMRSAQASRAPSDVDDSTASETPTQRSVMARSHSQQHSDLLPSNPVGHNRTSLPLAHTTQPDTSAIGASNPAPVSGQQIVFSVTDGRPQRPRTKRPMTKREKVAYKKTRERGACPSCRKQKAKVWSIHSYRTKLQLTLGAQCTHVDGVYTESEGREQVARLQPGKRYAFDYATNDGSLETSDSVHTMRTLIRWKFASCRRPYLLRQILNQMAASLQTPRAFALTLSIPPRTSPNNLNPIYDSMRARGGCQWQIQARRLRHLGTYHPYSTRMASKYLRMLSIPGRASPLFPVWIQAFQAMVHSARRIFRIFPKGWGLRRAFLDWINTHLHCRCSTKGCGLTKSAGLPPQIRAECRVHKCVSTYYDCP
ncbi:hypothetical protein FB567DRAFT_346049 [Paraphoma chrysanthemicola]|uniref:Uncharacterized protein n=1 Tax=Paraphoma chrysanthemicola TaxID=798071 RepID=A0A8K0VZ04_9PLEO|nr:hypothetical protein FB567DRAFT_346049 [Paraphoma chrysanthemicola]